MNSTAKLLLAYSWFVSSAIAVSGEVLVVDDDGGPGVDFVDLNAAISAAADGDTILLRPGVYADFHVTNKGVSILGDPGPAGIPPRILSVTSSIHAVPATSRFVLSGVRIERNWTTSFPLPYFTAVGIVECDGPVILEDCEVSGGAPSLDIRNCERVALARVSVTAWNAFSVSNSNPPGVAIDILDASVHAWDSNFRGGNGATQPLAPFPQTQDGLESVRITDGSLFISGGSAVGGNGSPATTPLFLPGCVAPGAGGPGVRVVSGQSLAILDSMLSGGAGGTGSIVCPGDGANGSAFVPGNATITIHPTSHRSLSVTSPLREGETAITTLVGEPNETVLLALSGSYNGSATPPVIGALAPGFPLVVAWIGALPQSGTLTFPSIIPANALPVGVNTLTLFEQFLVAGPNGKIVASSPQAVTFLDASF